MSRIEKKLRTSLLIERNKWPRLFKLLRISRNNILYPPPKKKAKEEINQTIPPFHGLAKSLSEDNKSVEVAT